MSKYETLNNRHKKFESGKSKIWLIILIIIIILAIGIGLYFVFKPSSNVTETVIKGNNSISKEQINSYSLESDVKWINLPLNITYDVPNKINNSSFNGTSNFSYMHGHSFEYYSNFNIYVEKSLENHQDLNTLAKDIVDEKLSEKYATVYQFGIKPVSFEISKNENLNINGIDTVYFESNEISMPLYSNKETKVKYIGYSFEYDNQYVSVYGELLMEEDNKQEELEKRLQYVIGSINEYDNQSFAQLGSNLKKSFDGGFVSTDDKITMNYYSEHSLNGALATSEDFCTELNTDYINWDGTLEGIFSATINQKLKESGYPAYYTNFNYWTEWERDESTGEWKNEMTYETLKEEDLKINDIDIKKYVIKCTANPPKTYGSYITIYSFIIDGKPYICEYNLDSNIYDDMQFKDVSDEQADVIIKQTEAVSDTFIRTLRIIEDGEDWIDFVTPSY